MPINTILFYVNVGLMFCSIAELATLLVMVNKTAFRTTARLAACMIFGFGLVAFIVQLVMFPMAHPLTVYFIYVALGIMYSGLVAAGVFAIMISGRSNRTLCIMTGVFSPLPPIGTVFTIILLRRVRVDSRAENLVYNGYTFTFSTLRGFCAINKVYYIDSGEVEEFSELDKKGAKAHVKALKKNAKTPQGWFEYGEALAHYYPKRMDEAVMFLRKAAKKDYPAALFNLGYFYEKGIGVRTDMKKASELYSRAAELGDKDAAIRLGIADIEYGGKSREQAGVDAFRKLADEGNECAMFDLALALDNGVGAKTPDIMGAARLYIKCVNIHAAQRRLFAIAAEHVQRPTDAELFRTVTGGEYKDDFALMMKGLVAVDEERAADAANLFLDAVKKRGKWEGVARCLVGALYIDCGALPKDRQNGAAYIKSAIGMTPVAKQLYRTIPQKIIHPKKDK